MKRKTLTTAVLAGLTGIAGMSGVANAVNLNPDGLGQVLLYPYYTARGGNQTLVSIVNTTERGKAVKIRFLEGLNSREVLDFNIYMSPFDVWVAAVSETEDGGGKITIPDNTCTVPYLFEDVDGEQAFLPFAFTGPASDARDPDFFAGDIFGFLDEDDDEEFWQDYLSAEFQQIERTASGYLEVLEMGTIDPDGDVGYHTAIKHVRGVPPRSALVDGEVEIDDDFERCGALVDAWTFNEPGSFLADSSQDMLPPSGGLLGSASIINLQEGTMFSYNATALDNWSDSIVHTDPGDLFPNLNNGTNVSAVFLSGQAGMPNVDVRVWEENFEAVSATIMKEAILNQYIIDDEINANTEWVITFPTKGFYADRGGFRSAVGPRARQPFVGNGWHQFAPFLGCQTASVKVWDREEQTATAEVTGPIVSPRPPDQPDPVFRLCGETNVVRFGPGSVAETELFAEPAGLLPSLFPRHVAIDPAGLGFDSGWVRLDFNDDDTGNGIRPTKFGTTPGIDPQTGSEVSYRGLPVIGFSAERYTNQTLATSAGDVLSNYGGTFQHRATRDVTSL